ncbi:MAG: PEGA domain-containing protein [Polyangiaceae bacterium]
MRRWINSLLMAAVAATWVPGWAQTPPDDAPVPSPDPDPPSGPGAAPPSSEAPSDAPDDSSGARAGDDGQPEDPAKVGARDAFLSGIEHAKRARWSEALASFERSARLRPLAVTTYNVAASLRAMGRYVLAKKAFEQALAQEKGQSFGVLSDTLREDTKTFIREIDGLLARATITLDPPTAALAVDGRPLELAQRGPRPVFLAGTRPAGKGEVPPAAVFDVLMNPGVHVFTLSRKGYADAVVNATFDPGETRTLDLVITKLPATLRISATEERAIVTVDGRDVGQTPIELSRREGDYTVSVLKDGFVPYETTVSLYPGQRMSLRADLAIEESALYEEWWFWTAIGVGVAAAAVTTYFIARPEPQRPAENCGGLNWCIYLDP